jgi:hypothetical protein
MSSPPPLLRTGSARACVHALLDWFRSDGEGAALLEIRGLRAGGPLYRAFAEVADERAQVAFCESSGRARSTLIIGDRAWGELTSAALPLSRWAKLAAARLIYT